MIDTFETVLAISEFLQDISWTLVRVRRVLGIARHFSDDGLFGLLAISGFSGEFSWKVLICFFEQFPTKYPDIVYIFGQTFHKSVNNSQRMYVCVRECLSEYVFACVRVTRVCVGVTV